MFARRFLPAAFLVNLFWALSAHAVSFTSEVENGFFKNNAIQTEHFQFEYSNLIENQADEDGDGIPNVVEILAETSEYGWETIVDDWNYEAPVPNGHHIIVILDENDEYLSSGALGITSVLSNGEPYIAIDPWMNEDYLKVTMVHEFFHAVQFGYDVNFAYTAQGINWAEASATWMEDQLYDEVDDYALYIPDFFAYIDYSLFATIVPSDSLYQYGMNIWPRFLAEYYDESIIKDIWEDYFDSDESYDSDLKLHDIVAEVLEDEGSSLSETFQEFTLWNLSLADYEEGDIYPEVLILDGSEDDEYVQGDENYLPALFGTNYLYFPNSRNKSNFRFHLLKGEELSFGVSLVPYTGDSFDLSRAQTTLTSLEDEMDVLSLDLDEDDEGVIAVISPLEAAYEDGYNWGVFDQGYGYAYLAAYGKSESEFNLLMGLSGDTEVDNEDKEGEEATQAPDTGIDHGLTLSLLTFDEDSATFTWNHVDNSKIDHFKLRYGKSSGNYNKSYETDNDYSTSATVNGLEEGETYYFELQAVNSSGKGVEDPSIEVSVTPQEWLFTDLSYMSEYYAAVQALVDAGVFSGYSDNSFRPYNEINRAELLKILIEGQGITPSASSYKNCFSDVSDEWFAKYVCYAKAEGWVKGYSDGNFRPSTTVNKVEALKMLFNAYGVELTEGSSVSKLNYTDLATDAWYSIYVWKASSLGILDETTGQSFRPADGRNRGDMAEELYRYLVVIDELKE